MSRAPGTLERPFNTSVGAHDEDHFVCNQQMRWIASERDFRHSHEGVGTCRWFHVGVSNISHFFECDHTFSKQLHKHCQHQQQRLYEHWQMQKQKHHISEFRVAL